MNYSLTDKDLSVLVPGCKVVIYNALDQYASIDQLLSKPCVILFEVSRRRHGHYVCMFKEGGTCFFFDSYGIGIEEQKDYVSRRMLKRVNYISRLLKESAYKVDYNPHCYQGKTSATCGRWCAVRLNNRALNDSEFFEWVSGLCKQYHVSPDELVVALTKPILGK